MQDVVCTPDWAPTKIDAARKGAARQGEATKTVSQVKLPNHVISDSWAPPLPLFFASCTSPVVAFASASAFEAFNVLCIRDFDELFSSGFFLSISLYVNIPFAIHSWLLILSPLPSKHSQ